jgi:hypothetical protein
MSLGLVLVRLLLGLLDLVRVVERDLLRVLRGERVLARVLLGDSVRVCVFLAVRDAVRLLLCREGLRLDVA